MHDHPRIGQTVEVKNPAYETDFHPGMKEWMPGVVTDCFYGPVTREYITVVRGLGFYPHEERIPA